MFPLLPIPANTCSVWFLNSSCPKGCDIISRCNLNLHFSSDEWCLASFRVWQPSAHLCKMSAQVLCLFFFKTWLFLLVVLCYWGIFCHNIYPISGCDNQKKSWLQIMLSSTKHSLCGLASQAHLLNNAMLIAIYIRLLLKLQVLCKCELVLKSVHKMF